MRIVVAGSGGFLGKNFKKYFSRDHLKTLAICRVRILTFRMLNRY